MRERGRGYRGKGGGGRGVDGTGGRGEIETDDFFKAEGNRHVWNSQKKDKRIYVNRWEGTG